MVTDTYGMVFMCNRVNSSMLLSSKAAYECMVHRACLAATLPDMEVLSGDVRRFVDNAQFMSLVETRITVSGILVYKRC